MQQKRTVGILLHPPSEDQPLPEDVEFSILLLTREKKFFSATPYYPLPGL